MHFCGNLIHDLAVNAVMLGQVIINTTPAVVHHCAQVVRDARDLHHSSTRAAQAFRAVRKRAAR